MKNSSITTLIFLAINFYAFTSAGQTTLLTMDDVVLSAKRGLVPDKMEHLQWKGNSNEFVFLQKEKGTEILVAGIPGEKTYRDIVSISRFNQILKSSGFDSVTTFPAHRWKDENSFTFESKGITVRFDVVKSVATKILDAPVAGAAHKEFHTKGEIMAYTVDNNIWITIAAGNKQVTFDSATSVINGQIVHREEFGIHKGIFFSPSGKQFAFYRMDESMVTEYPLLNLADKPASAKTIRYPMAGAASHHVTVGVYNVATGKTIFLKTGEPAEQYLTNIAWSPDDKKIFVAILNRAQNHMWMNRYDASTGSFEATLFEEKDEKYVHPLHPVEFNNSGSNFIWQSRRDGYNHLYLYDAAGKLIKQLTKGKWEVADFIGFDDQGKNVFYTSNEIKPVNKDIFVVDIAKAKSTRVSLGDGIHKGLMNHKGTFVINEFTGPGVPRSYTIVSSNGKKSNSLLLAPDPLSKFMPVTREVFTIKNENGDDLYCRLTKPSNFDSTKAYPVIIYVYGGPNVQLITNNWQSGGDLWSAYMAQRGILVFTLENRGTPMRGKDFEQAIFRNLGEVEMQDQVMGVKYLMSKRYIDKNKIGIYGWSYGGFMSISMMTRQPGLFRAAVAGGPVIDWNYYEIMYTERYMDTPQENPEGFAKSSLLNYVEGLKGKMLLIHGTSDNVVVWQHSLLYLKKAVEKNVQVDYFVYPGHEHNVTGRDRIHLLNKISQYFMDNFK